jgi:hypothetical protein
MIFIIVFFSRKCQYFTNFALFVPAGSLVALILFAKVGPIITDNLTDQKIIKKTASGKEQHLNWSEIKRINITKNADNNGIQFVFSGKKRVPGRAI